MKEKKVARITKVFGKCALAAVIAVCALVGAFNLLQSWQTSSITSFVEEKDRGKQYDPDLLYRKDFGAPVFLINPAYKKTLFFIEGFRIPNSAEAWYGDWMKKVHVELKTNIISPMYGLQGWPFPERNREWYYQEDMRQVLQIYQAYTAMLPKEHRIILASMSFGTLPSLTICAKAGRLPDAVVLMSPLNSRLDFRLSGPTVAWIAGQMMEREWLSSVIMYNRAAVAPNRASQYDIVNRDASLYWISKSYVNPEDNMKQGYMSHRAARFMESSIVPQVRGMKIQMIWGDDDLFFAQNGFMKLADMLSKRNAVKTMVLKNSGHSILLDNEKDKAYTRLEDIIRGNY